MPLLCFTTVQAELNETLGHLNWIMLETLNQKNEGITWYIFGYVQGLNICFDYKKIRKGSAQP